MKITIINHIKIIHDSAPPNEYYAEYLKRACKIVESLQIDNLRKIKLDSTSKQEYKNAVLERILKGADNLYGLQKQLQTKRSPIPRTKIDETELQSLLRATATIPSKSSSKHQNRKKSKSSSNNTRTNKSNPMNNNKKNKRATKNNDKRVDEPSPFYNEGVACYCIACFQLCGHIKEYVDICKSLDVQ